MFYLALCSTSAVTTLCAPHEGEAAYTIKHYSEHSPELPAPVFKKINISDGLRCFTDYQPQPNGTDSTMSLKRLAVSHNILEPDPHSKAMIPYIPGKLFLSSSNFLLK